MDSNDVRKIETIELTGSGYISLSFWFVIGRYGSNPSYYNCEQAEVGEGVYVGYYDIISETSQMYTELTYLPYSYNTPQEFVLNFTIYGEKFKIEFRQDSHSGDSMDVWSVDDVKIAKIQGACNYPHGFCTSTDICTCDSLHFGLECEQSFITDFLNLQPINMTWAIIAGVAVVIVLFACCCICLLICCCCYATVKKKDQKVPKMGVEMEVEESPGDYVNSSSNYEMPKPTFNNNINNVPIDPFAPPPLPITTKGIGGYTPNNPIPYFPPNNTIGSGIKGNANQTNLGVDPDKQYYFMGGKKAVSYFSQTPGNPSDNSENKGNDSSKTDVFVPPSFDPNKFDFTPF